MQVASVQILLVDGGNLQFAACRGLDVLGNIHHTVRIEIEAHDGIVRLRVLGFLLDAQTVAVGIELGHAIALGVVDIIAEHGGLALLLGALDGILQHAGESAAVEDVVAQHEAGTVVADELFADDERLRQTVGRGLLGILEAHTQVFAGT